MTNKERQQLIDYIKLHDQHYDYSAVDFQFYTDEDLLRLKQRIDRNLRSESGLSPEDDGPQSSANT